MNSQDTYLWRSVHSWMDLPKTSLQHTQFTFTVQGNFKQNLHQCFGDRANHYYCHSKSDTVIIVSTRLYKLHCHRREFKYNTNTEI